MRKRLPDSCGLSEGGWRHLLWKDKQVWNPASGLSWVMWCDRRTKPVRGWGLHSPHVRVSACLVKCHFWLHLYSAPSICLFLIQIMSKSTAKAMRDTECDKGWREADGRELAHGKAAWPPVLVSPSLHASSRTVQKATPSVFSMVPMNN